MTPGRYRATSSDSFFGGFLYDQVLNQDHFLVRARREIDWGELSRGFDVVYKGGGEYGPTPYDPSLLLRYLLIPYLFNISEREAEDVVRHNLLAKYFVGLGVDQLPPDHSTLTIFKRRLGKIKGQSVWERLLDRVLKQAVQKGIVFGSIQIIDSTHTTANVNRGKDKQRTKSGKPPRDQEARGGVKRMETKTAIDRVTQRKIVVREPVRIYGYKAHVSLNEKTGIITSVTTTPANEADTNQFIPLVEKDRHKNLPVKAVTADKGYDGGDNHTFCEERGITPAIALKKTRTAPRWRDLANKSAYQEALRLRPRIEAKFGQAKVNHGFSRCRYLGLTNYKIQTFLTMAVLNLKRIMALTEESFSFPPQTRLAYARIPVLGRGIAPPGLPKYP